MSAARLFQLLAAGSRTLSTRRLLLFLTGILLLSFTLLFFASSSLSASTTAALPGPDSLKEHVRVPSIPSIPNPFHRRPPTHKAPPPGVNSTSSAAGWFSSWTWRNPFFSDDSADPDRIALPPLTPRCPVYTFYDSNAQGETRETEDRLLLAWRRAWWAMGFKPVILGMGEAAQNGAYEKVMRDQLKGDTEREIMKWLAWAQMGRGVFADYRVFPIGMHDDFTISALRRCDFAFLTRYEKLEGLLYTADGRTLSNAISAIISNPIPSNSTEPALENLLPRELANVLFNAKPTPPIMAAYTAEVVKKHYSMLEPKDLPRLINAHLHQTFLSHYREGGIAILSPFGDALAALLHPAAELAQRLAQCPTAPLSNTCAPNGGPQDPKCMACAKCILCAKALTITRVERFDNATNTFLLATVPHPLHVLALAHSADLRLDADGADDAIRRFVRRNTQRDPWLRAATKDLVPSGLGPGPRLTRIKDAVVSGTGADPGVRDALWSTPETGWENVEWQLGFTLPTREEASEMPNADPKMIDIVKLADAAVKKAGKKRSVVERWSLADTEAWRFAKAIGERRKVEREGWSKSEKGFGKGLAGEER